MRWLKNGISKFGSLWYLTADKYRDAPQNVRKVMNNKCLDDLARIKWLYPIQAHCFGSGRANICFLVNPISTGSIYSLQYQMESPLRMLQVPSTLCRRFDSSVQKEDSISRDWLVQLWLAEKRKENVRRKGKRISVLNVQIRDTVSEALPFFQLPSMRSVLSSLVPDEYETPVKGTVKQPPISQYDGRFLSPSSPDEIKLEPLLARANLLITRDIEWANIMFAFEQENRYMIVDPCYPQSPAGSIREQSNLVFRQILRTRRPFVARITDAMGTEIFRVRRPFWLINSTIYAEVDGKEVGVVHRRWHLWRRIYDLYMGNKQFAVVENPGFWNWTFTLKDDNDNVLAQIDRNWRGFGFELFTDAGQYVIRFGDSDAHSKPSLASAIQSLEISRPLTLSERAVTVALAVSLDCDYFSRSHGGWGLPVLIAGE